jgi:hypothetical protein
MIRTLTDAQRATLGYGGPFVAMKMGISVDELKKDVHGPSGTLLASYKQHFRSEQAFIKFIQDVIFQPIGSALDGRLTWLT